jgi:transmembrane sensor
MKQILEKYIRNECSKEDFKQAVSVLLGVKGKADLNDYMSHHWKKDRQTEAEEKSLKYKSTLDRIHHLINLKEERRSGVNRFISVFSKIAAVLLLPLIFATSYYLIRNNTNRLETLTTLTVPEGMQSRVELPDGSIVWLNAESSLTYPSSFNGDNSRKVVLNGEGYFEVAKNNKRPFYVSTNELVVKVLGTKFNVAAYESSKIVAVALLEGSVELSIAGNEDDKGAVGLVPMQLARFKRLDKTLDVQSDEMLERYIAWKDGKMIFIDEPFENVMEQMGRKYNVDYTIESNEIAKYSITGTFNHETLEEFMEILKRSSPIKFEIENRKIKNDGSYGKRKVIVKQIIKK